MTQNGTSSPRRPVTLAALGASFRYWRRWLKSKLPVVRRTVHRKLEARHSALLEAIAFETRPADACALVAAKEAAVGLGPELCLFVTYSPQPRLKRHVVRHVGALRAAGVKVILIVNTPLPPDRIEIEPAFRDGLAGLFLRKNEGFDFAAWAHALRRIDGRLGECERLLLTNDSIVGPLRDGELAGVLDRIRASPADLVGLTENAEPRHHLQSFFIAFQRRALASEPFRRFWSEVVSLPSKDAVIALYECFMTERFRRAGLSCAALFRIGGIGSMLSNDTYYRWAELIEDGFPFVKASVLERFWRSRDVKRLVPTEILDDYEFANGRPPGP